MGISLARVLLVEDNANDEILTLRAFKRNSFGNPIDVVRDGLQAIEHLDQMDTTLPALVLLDLKLPRVDGIEVLRHIRSRERTKLLPVVVLTTSVEQKDLLDSYQLGANAYVRKPVDFSEFVGAIAKVAGFWLSLNELPYGD